jgi:alkanesulfonate monooxygenase SsuD/methylene tetrahydromethanopterin reductase-like flavin-dependent oxidoreductase (luciferase family)
MDVPPFGELADPRVLAGLAAAAEERGWDGFFVWDHIAYRAPVRAVADPWVALAAVACATSRLRIGPLITPLSRRRVHKVARETVTLDLLSSGRLTLGVGLGRARNGELEPFGEVADPRERARRLDQGLDDLARYWGGEFEPVPVQRPRIPVWVAAEWPHRRPVRRALRWDGLFPIRLPGPAALAELTGEVREARPAADPFGGRRDLDGHRFRPAPHSGRGARGHRRGPGLSPRLHRSFIETLLKTTIDLLDASLPREMLAGEAWERLCHGQEGPL